MRMRQDCVVCDESEDKQIRYTQHSTVQYILLSCLAKTLVAADHHDLLLQYSLYDPRCVSEHSEWRHQDRLVDFVCTVSVTVVEA